MKINLYEEYGRLVPFEEIGDGTVLRCTCRCGRTHNIRAELINKSDILCGCARRDKPKLISKNINEVLTRGDHIKSIWKSLIRSADLGELEVDSRWVKSFKNFSDDMCCPATPCALLRKDPTEPYNKENCYWSNNG